MTKKKKTLACLLVALSACSLAFGFAACNKKKSKTSFTWDASVVQNNIQQEDSSVEAEEVNESVIDMMSVTFEKGTYDVLTTDYIPYGIVPVKNSAGYVGFYSLHYQKMLIAAQYKEEWMTYRIQPIDQLGYIVEISYEDTIVTYDSMGNKILERLDVDTYKIQSSDIVYEMDTQSDISCAQLKITVTEHHDNGNGQYDDNKVTTTYASYDYVTSVCTLKNSLSISMAIEETESNVYDGPAAGDLYVTESKIDLDDFQGLTGYYLIKKDNVYYIYDANNVIQNSYAVKEGINVIQIGSKLICQERVVVADDEAKKNYDFCVSSYMSVTKYKLHSFSVDILTGKVTELDFGYVINGQSVPYEDGTGKATYALIALTKINDDKTINTAASEYCIVDQNATIIKELTGIPVESFIKIGENYYNTANNIIYSATLKELAYIGDITPTLDKVNELFICKLDGKYGAVNYNGIVTIPFKYDSLKPLESTFALPSGALIDAKDDYILAEKNDQIFRVNIRNGGETFICDKTAISAIEDDLYKISLQSGKFIQYLSQSKDYITIDNTSEEIYNILNSQYTFTSKIGNAQYIFMRDEKTRNNFTPDNTTDDTTTLKISTFNVNNFANHDTFQTIGEEITTDVALGRFYGDKITLVEGANRLHSFNGNPLYVTFTPTADGEYTFVGNDLSSISIMDELYASEIESMSAQSTAGTKAVIFELKKDTTYVMKVTLSDDFEVIAIEKAVPGKYQVAPIAVTDFTAGDVKITLPAGQKYAYVGIAPTAEILQYPSCEYTVTYTYNGNIEINYNVTAYPDKTGQITYTTSWSMPISPYVLEIIRSDYAEQEEITLTFTHNITPSSGTVLNPYVIKASEQNKSQNVYLGEDEYSVDSIDYTVIRTRYVQYKNDTNNSLLINLNVDNTASSYDMDYGCVVATNAFVTTTDLVSWNTLSQKIANEQTLTEEELVEYNRLCALGIIGGAVDADYNCELLVESNRSVYVFLMGPQTSGYIDVSVQEYAVNTVNTAFTMDNDNGEQKVYYTAAKDGYYNFNAAATLVNGEIETPYSYYTSNYVVYRADGTTYYPGSNVVSCLLLNKGDVVVATITLNSTLSTDTHVNMKLALVTETLPASVTFAQADDTVKNYVYTATQDGFVYLDASATLTTGGVPAPYTGYTISYSHAYTENYGTYSAITPNTPIYLTAGQQIVVRVNSNYAVPTGDTLTVAVALQSYTAMAADADVSFAYAALAPVETKSYEYTVAANGFYEVSATAKKITDTVETDYANYTATMYYGEMQTSLPSDMIYLEQGQKVVIQYTLSSSLTEGETVNVRAQFTKLSDVVVGTTANTISATSEKYQLLVEEDTTYRIVLRTDYSSGQSYTKAIIRNVNGTTVSYSSYITWAQNSSSDSYEYKCWYTLPAGEYTVEFQRSASYSAWYTLGEYADVETFTRASSTLYNIENEIFEKNFEQSNRKVSVSITNDTTVAKYYEIRTNLSSLALIKYPGAENESSASISNGQIIKLAPGQSIAIDGVATYTSTTYTFTLVNIQTGNAYSQTSQKVAYKVLTADEYKQINVKLTLDGAYAHVYRMNGTTAYYMSSINGNSSSNGSNVTVYEDVTYIIKVTDERFTSDLLNYLTVTD